MNTTFLNINGSVINSKILTNFNGAFLENNSLFVNLNGETEFPTTSINDLSIFLQETLKPTYVDLLNNYIINNNQLFTLEVYPIYNNTLVLDSMDKNINITNPNNNTVLVFIELNKDNISAFSNINFVDLSKTAFYIKIFKIIDDKLVVPEQLENITITIPIEKLNNNNDNQDTIRISKFNDGDIQYSKIFDIKKNDQNNFIFTINSTSTYLITTFYRWYLGSINVGQNIQLFARPPQKAPETYYHSTVEANLYELFDNYHYKQINIESVAINFTYDENQINKILDSEHISSPGKFTTLMQGNLGIGKTGKNNGSINGSEKTSTNLNLRLLEIVAIHLFGHAKARAAIRNDTEFNFLSGTIKRGIIEKFDGNVKELFFKQYVGSGKYVNSNDTEIFAPFNLEDSSIRYQIEFTVDNIFDSTGQQLTQITNENRLWHTNLAIDFVHNPAIPRF